MLPQREGQDASLLDILDLTYDRNSLGHSFEPMGPCRSHVDVDDMVPFKRKLAMGECIGDNPLFFALHWSRRRECPDEPSQYQLSLIDTTLIRSPVCLYIRVSHTVVPSLRRLLTATSEGHQTVKRGAKL